MKASDPLVSRTCGLFALHPMLPLRAPHQSLMHMLSCSHVSQRVLLSASKSPFGATRLPTENRLVDKNKGVPSAAYSICWAMSDGQEKRRRKRRYPPSLRSA